MAHLSDAGDPAFWRAGAISTTIVMLVVLVFLTIDSLGVIRAGGSHVPPYTAINQEIGYVYNVDLGYDVPTIGKDQPLFGKKYGDAEAHALISKGKLVIQSRACMDCHTFFGNGAYFGPDLTKAWLDPSWDRLWEPMTKQATREGAMVAFLMDPDKYPTWSREMPNLHLTREEAVALVAYLKWMSAVDTNGFPANFRTVETSTASPPPASPGLAPGPSAPAPASRVLTQADLVAIGQKAYASQCAACHQANGLGVAGTFPPITIGKEFSAAESVLKPLAERGFYKDGKIAEGPVKQHIDIVLNGIAGTPMPGFGGQLDDTTVAALVTYERNAFGNKTGDVVQATDVRAVRAGPAAASGSAQ
jgi:nitric oxide reductase subunit C